MFTVIETPIFQQYSEEVWTDTEREAVIAWLATNPHGGAVIPGTGGLRKVRWPRPGMGKRGGARVIYFNPLDHGMIGLLIVYPKAKFDNLPTTWLSRLKEELING